MAHALHAIKSERVTDTVYDMLRESIVNRTFAPGEKLNVDDIARRLDVSRTPVHEALAILAADGLVEVVPRRGTFVAEFTLTDYAETLEVRRALELLACETACTRASDRDAADLASLAEAMQVRITSASDATEAARHHDALNVEFHTRIVHLSGNRRLIDLYEDLRVHLRIARAHLDATSWLDRVPTETAEHRAIVDALTRRDVAAMQRALEAHLRRSSASLIADLESHERRSR